MRVYYDNVVASGLAITNFVRQGGRGPVRFRLGIAFIQVGEEPRR